METSLELPQALQELAKNLQSNTGEEWIQVRIMQKLTRKILVLNRARLKRQKNLDGTAFPPRKTGFLPRLDYELKTGQISIKQYRAKKKKAPLLYRLEKARIRKRERKLPLIKALAKKNLYVERRGFSSEFTIRPGFIRKHQFPEWEYTKYGRMRMPKRDVFGLSKNQKQEIEIFLQKELNKFAESILKRRS